MTISELRFVPFSKQVLVHILSYEMRFQSAASESHFHINVCALSLASIERLKIDAVSRNTHTDSVSRVTTYLYESRNE